ncbi:MAG: HNH endonuclease [Gammaproteobacteria bacterium]|nr:HNH endonuclease [Gammaproteobacteria bacterium]
MHFWWVNQNQTFEQEFRGGYLWSPKRKSDGSINPFYESMREVAPGDLIFSFEDTRVRAIGIATSYARESPKPPEFGTAGPNWSLIGWRVDVDYRILQNQIKPIDHIARLRPYLPTRYSPLQDSGRGNQGVYLTWVESPLAEELISLIGLEGRQFWEQAKDTDKQHLPESPGDVDNWEDHVKKQIESDNRIPETEKSALILSRRGQGLFKQRVSVIEHACRVTKVDRPEHLIASHCKPWRDSSNEERLDGENGLLLTPSIDHLFDRGFISFDNDGTLLISPVAHKPSLQRMGIPVTQHMNVGKFSSGQKTYLDFHRESVFLLSRRQASST